VTAPSLRFTALLAAGILGCQGSSTGPDAARGPIDAHPADGCLDLPTAPESKRVDLATPIFSNPTNVTNPLFPISRLFRVILLGQVDGLPFRAETTLLPDTRTIDLDGKRVETLVSQYAAFLDGRIHEIALDFYAQADDGAAWYFGEDVFNYEDGVIADTEGTWLAGRDGPAAMIMPANPQVGDVWRPENICELVFEEVTAKATGVTVDGPHGAVQGAIVVEELHMDSTLEDKTFAPGYGEFFTGGGGDIEAVALAVPEDALPGLPPKELELLSSGAAEIFNAAQAKDWEAASASVEEMSAAWDSFKEGEVPLRLGDQMDGALEELAAAVELQESADTRQAAINAARASLDLQLRYRTAAETDLDLLDLWARQLVVDSEAGERDAMIGDAATLRWIRDRIARDVSPAELRSIDSQIADLRMAAEAGDPGRAATAAASFRVILGRTHLMKSRR
jgi:hypothetical protein